MGGAVLAIAPRVTLRAVADGLTPAHGAWSIVAHGDRLIGLLGTDGGAEVRELAPDGDGLLRVGRLVTGGAPLGTIALGLADRGPIVLGTRAETPAPPPPDPAAHLTTLLGPVFDGEPDPPGPAVAAAVRVVASLHDLLGRTIAAGGAELLTARLGPWSVHQHGPDDEADHLDQVTVRHHGRRVLTLGDLGMAGSATLGGAATTPALAVADDRDQVHAVDLTDGSVAPPIDATRPWAVVGTAQGLTAATVEDGRLVLTTLTAGTWTDRRALPGIAGATDVLAVTGAGAVVAATTHGLQLLRLEGR